MLILGFFYDFSVDTGGYVDSIQVIQRKSAAILMLLCKAGHVLWNKVLFVFVVPPLEMMDEFMSGAAELDRSSAPYGHTQSPYASEIWI